MARGLPTRQVPIGHSLYGVIGQKKWKWFVAIKDVSLALKYAEEKLGMKNPKAYPIYKDQPSQQ